MKHIMQLKRENVYSVRPVENGSELSESEIKILESGFPDQWLVIYENAYGELNIQRMTSEQVKIKYGKVPPISACQVGFSFSSNV